MSNIKVEGPLNGWVMMHRVKRKPGLGGLLIPDDTGSLFMGMTSEFPEVVYLYEPSESYCLTDSDGEMVDIVRRDAVVCELSDPTHNEVVSFYDNAPEKAA